MVKLNRAQRLALKAKFDRGPIYAKINRIVGNVEDEYLTTGLQLEIWQRPLTYRQFRKRVQPMFDGSGGVMVHWCGMWLGIETDGYTHS